MKTLNYIFPFLLFVVGFTAKAEDSIVNRNITVEREYKPVIQDAGKIKSIPKVLEPKVTKISPVFSDFNLPMNADNYNIQTLPAAQLQRENRPESKGGFARIGFGNYYNTMGDIAYPIVNNSDMKLDFSLNHLGTFGTKAHSNSKAALSFDKYFENMDLYAGVGEGHEYFKYYGDNFNNGKLVINLDTLAANNSINTASYMEQDMTNINRAAKSFKLSELAKDSISNTVWRFNAFAGVRSLPLAKGVRYKAELNFKAFEARNGLIETRFLTKGGFDTHSGENRLGVDLELNNLVYKSNNAAILNFLDSYSVLAMNPFYSIEEKDFNIRLGVKSSFSFVHGRPFSPSADIHAEWKAIPKYLALYGGITGSYGVNTMDEMFSENRYLYSDVRVKDTYSPFEIYAGMKVKPVYNLLMDFYMDYRKIDNQYFFVNKEYKSTTVATADSILYSNRFNVIYSGASLFKIGVRANYNLRNKVNVELKGAYNGWEVTSERYAWNKPKWEASMNTDVKITRNFSVSANAFLESERWAKLGTLAINMNPKVDISLGAAYSYNNWFTAFAKLNNLIDNRYQNYFGYDIQGFNAMVGAAFSF
jgi:hypothetical protein